MSTIEKLDEDEISFLTPYLPQPERSAFSRHEDRPFVTLTYACSLDGMISLAPGVRTTLSGTATKSMTHYLRLKHDAILVGVNTAIADKPSLNCRYPGVDLSTQPLPVIVDPQLRWQPEGSPVVKLSASKQGKNPIIVHCKGAEPLSSTSDIRYLPVKEGNPIHWRAILSALKEQGLESVMIEGGAAILNSLLTQPDLVDAVIVTIAPTWLGQGGVHVSPSAQEHQGQRMNAATLSATSWKQFGADVVLCGRLTT